MKRTLTLDECEACFIIMTNCLDISLCLFVCSTYCQSSDTYSKKWKFPRGIIPHILFGWPFIGTVIHFEIEYVFYCVVCLKNCEKVFVKTKWRLALGMKSLSLVINLMTMVFLFNQHCFNIHIKCYISIHNCPKLDCLRHPISTGKTKQTWLDSGSF